MSYGLLDTGDSPWGIRQPGPLQVPTLPQPLAHRSIWDRIRTGAEKLVGVPSAESGLLTPEDRKAALRQGLLTLGSTISGADPSGSTAGAIAQGLRAAQGGTQQALEQQDALRQRSIALDKAGRLAMLQQKYVGKTDPASLATFARELYLAGFPNEATKVAEGLKAMAPNVEDQIRVADSARRTAYRQAHPEYGTYSDSALDDVMKNAVAKPTEVADKKFTKQKELYGQFLQQTAPHLQVAEAYRRVRAAGDNPSAAGDIGLLTGYMKIVDPSSSVREGEFATAASAGSVPQRIWGMYNRVLTGQRLTDEQRKDFITQAGYLARNTKASLSEIQNSYNKKAKEFDLNPDSVSYDYFSGLTLPDNPGAAPASPAGPAPVVKPGKVTTGKAGDVLDKHL